MKYNLTHNLNLVQDVNGYSIKQLINYIDDLLSMRLKNYQHDKLKGHKKRLILLMKEEKQNQG